MPIIIEKLKTHPDYSAVFKSGVFCKKKGIIVQFCLVQQESETEPAVDDVIFVGITASKKVGNAIKRNFAKRRIRAYCREFITDDIKSYLFDKINNSNAKKIKLSKKTINSMTQKNDNFSGIALVFIATNKTNQTNWAELCQEITTAIKDCTNYV